MPRALEQVGKVFQSESQIDIVYGNGFKLIDEKLHPILVDKFHPVKYVFGCGNFLQQSIFYRLQSLHDKEIIFNSNNRTCWDAEFLIMCHKKGMRFLRLNKVLSVFRIHSDSISGSNRLVNEYETEQSKLSSDILRPIPFNGFIKFLAFYFGKSRALIRILQVRIHRKDFNLQK